MKKRIAAFLVCIIGMFSFLPEIVAAELLEAVEELKKVEINTNPQIEVLESKDIPFQESTVENTLEYATTEELVINQGAVSKDLRPEVRSVVLEEGNSYFERNQITEAFIKEIGEQAKQIAYENNLYASVMIAQAILESGSGNSSLACAPYYNLFGIKGEYNNASILMETWEEDNSGHIRTVYSGFRQYPNYSDSLQDYASLLTNGLPNNPEFYKSTWKSTTNTYLEATAALTGRYATDHQYANKLNELIQHYRLTDYDQVKKKENSDVLTASNESEKTAQFEVKVRKVKQIREIPAQKIMYLFNHFLRQIRMIFVYKIS